MDINTQTASPQKKVLCVILSYNVCDDTLECIKSLLNNKPDGFDLLVVDNASEAGVVERLQASYPQIETIALKENLGWAGGNNVGIRLGLERGYQWICLLNNDTVFKPESATRMVQVLDELPPSLVHPAIYYWDEPEVSQLDPAQQNPVAAGQWHGRHVLKLAYGACLSIHREVFEKIGLLDERFFLQLEETDFYHRADKAGYFSVCDSSIVIYHKESRAFGGRLTPVKTYYSTRNTLLLIEKKSGSLGARLKDLRKLYWTLSNVASAAYPDKPPRIFKFPRWFFSGESTARGARYGVWDYFSRRFGKIPEAHLPKLKRP